MAMGKCHRKKAHVLVLGIFHKVHCMTTCKEFEEKNPSVVIYSP